MKPAFALDFRNDAIALLHRTSGGWHQVGRVTFDEPDLPAALSYLRATALGLSPRGLATKLILPDDQVLFTTVEAPGPDADVRDAQIRAALQGVTPYAVEDLVFDWQDSGDRVQVAVIARETLAEAEAFATEHRFNPVAFAAAPANGFTKEPWFGPSALAPSLLANGESVERDDAPLGIVDRAAFEEPSKAEPVFAAPISEAPIFEAPPVSEPEPQPSAQAEFEPAFLSAATLDAAPDSDPDLDSGPDLDSDPDSGPIFDPISDAEFESNLAAEILAADRQLADRLAAAPPPFAETAASEPPAAAFRQAAAPETTQVSTQVAPPPAAPPIQRETPIFGLADDEPSPSAVFRAGADVSPRFDGDLPADLAAALQDTNLHDIVLEEAPMALDVEDDGEDTAPAGQPQKARVTDLSLPTDDALDDLPLVPGYSPAMGFASRRATADEVRLAKVPPPPLRPAVSRPTSAKPLAPAAPKAERPMVSRPTAAAPVVAKEGKGLRGLGAFVSAPSLTGARKKVMIPTHAPIPAPSTAPGLGLGAGAASATASVATASTAASATAATAPAKSLGQGLGARPAPVRGKPRYLGLALTVILLVVLAVIAAWSTSLAFRSNEASDTAIAANEAVPAPDDEMLADGIDPEAQIDAITAPSAIEGAVAEAMAPPEPAPTALAAGQDTAPAPAVNPGASSGDEIFLASRETVPVAPEPLDLPEVSAQGDPVPNAQAPPPPFGTVYQFDANGLIVPTPEGIITPEGVLLVAGKPPVVPKARPEGLSPPPVDPASTSGALPPVDPAAEAGGETAFPSDPALAKFRPKTRPEGLVPPAPNPDEAALVPQTEAPPSETATTETPAAEALAVADPALATIQAAGSDNRLVSLRPRARPQVVLAAGDATRAATAAAAASLAQTEAASVAAAELASGPASKLAIAISRKPQPRPLDLSRSVEAAVAAAVRTPEPEPDPEPAPKAKAAQPKPEPVAKPEPTVLASPKRPKETGRDAGNSADPEAQDEPDVAVASTTKSQGSVAKQATFKNALNLSKTALIGVYGTPSNRYAMIRTESGRYKKVKVGDKIDGGSIKAITANEVRYQKGARLVTLAMPKS